MLLLHLLDSDWWKVSVSRLDIGKSSSSRKGDSGRDGTVHLLHGREEPAAAEAPAPFPRTRGSSRLVLGREAQQQAPAVSVYAPLGHSPSTNFRVEINAEKICSF